LINDESARPIFTPDKAGDYTFTLVVNDGEKSSDPAIVTVSVSNNKNQPPQAKVKTAQTGGMVGETISLDGSDSSDEDGDTLTYDWTFKSKPASSRTKIEEPEASVTEFIPDKKGMYVVQLMVNDGKTDSSPSTVEFEIDEEPIPEAGIVPGNRISDLSLGQTYEKIVTKHGQPDVIDGNMFFYHQKGIAGTLLDENKNGKIDNFEPLFMISCFEPFKGKTTGDNSVGSSIKNFEREFGIPDEIGWPIHFWWRKGISVAEDKGKAEMIFVFIPMLNAAPPVQQGKAKTLFPDLHDFMERISNLTNDKFE
jgi:hypothetical protein